VGCVTECLDHLAKDFSTYMYVYILHNNDICHMHFYLHEVMNAGSDSDAQKFRN